jgi:hypothetical protein
MAKAKSPTTSKPNSKKAAPKSKAPAAEPEHVDSPLTAKEHLFRIAYQLSRMHGFTDEDAPDRELWALVEEQFILPQNRAVNRYHRRANEMLCQKLENDERFREAVAVAKGGVF